MSIEAPAADTPGLMDTPVDQLPVVDAGNPPVINEPVVEETAEQIAARETEAATAEETRRAALTDDERAAEDAEKLAAAGAPETYDAFTVPEGFELAEDKLTAFTEFAKAKGLTQAEAQGQIEMATTLVQEALQAQAAAFAETADGWRASVIADPELGGAKLAENLALAVKARDQFGSPALKELLDQSRLGDNPEVIRFFHNVGKAMSEDSFVAGGQKTTTANFYTHPTSQPKA